MPCVQPSGTTHRVGITIRQGLQRWLGQYLPTAETRPRSPLRFTPFNVGGLILDVQDKPQLEVFLT